MMAPVVALFAVLPSSGWFVANDDDDQPNQPNPCHADGPPDEPQSDGGRTGGGIERIRQHDQ
jgi:hypothetical protein